MVLVYAVICLALLRWNATRGDRPLEKLPPDVSVPMHGAGKLSGEQLRNTVARKLTTLSPLRWSAVQWVLYDGPEWTAAAALTLIGLWSAARVRRQWRQSPQGKQRSEARWRLLITVALACMARAAAGAATIGLAIYLLLAPLRIGHFEEEYQHEMLRIRNPKEFWAGLEDIQNQLSSNPQYMQQLRNQVQREVSPPQ